ncbi:MAG: M3 family metallopeptidase [Bryobacteraceae bacterium]
MAVDEQNPLLHIGYRIPFDQIRAEHVEPGITALIGQARESLEALAAPKPERTYANTLAILDNLSEPLDIAVNVVRHLEAVVTYPALRQAYNAIEGPASEFYSSVVLHEGLWNALKEYAGTPEAAGLRGTPARFLKKTIDSFRRQGADLDPAGKQRMSEIDVELSKVTTKFGQNVLDATNAFELVITDPAQLAGLPPSALEAAREDAKRKQVEGWRFTLQAPSYLAVLTYLDNAAIREQMYRANSTRASSGQYDNRPLIPRILELRKEKAKLVGFADFADFVLEDRMAKSGGAALAFLEGLKHRTEEAFARENDALLAFRRGLEGAEAAPLQPWDIAYYAEKQRAALYDFDEEALRPYFPLPRVVDGMFHLVQRLYGIRVTERSDVPKWHPETQYYEIHDEDGTFLGAFYADWYPRETKRPGAWMDAFITGQPKAGQTEPHLGLICGNLTPPVGERPALLTHREVETIFHEFGHLLHHLLTKVEVRSLAGTAVAWDFVELPSQIMENWCWERESLDLLAAHYETGEPVPTELYEKLRAARTFRAGNGQMRQLSLGMVDLALHRKYNERDGDVVAWSRALLQQFTPAPLPAEHAMIAAFTHLFSGPVAYASGYYSYKWAEVLDADAFTRFKKEGIFSRSVGKDFREQILSKGDSEDPAQLYRGFMGRDPDLTALLIRSGLAT